MKNQLNSTGKSLMFESISTLRITQLKTTFQYLSTQSATIAMVSAETDIPKESITSYIRHLKRHGHLAKINKAPCKITGFNARFLTTDPDLIPNNNQLSLFEEYE